MGIGFKRGGTAGYAKVNVSAQTGGTATGGGRYKKGETVTLQVTFGETYAFAGWYVGDALLSTSTTYTFVAGRSMDIVARMRAKTLKSRSIVSGQIGVTNSYSFAYPNGIRPARIEYTVWLSNAAPYRDVVSQTVTGNFYGSVAGHVENENTGAYQWAQSQTASISFNDASKAVSMSWPSYAPKRPTNLYLTAYWYE